MTMVESVEPTEAEIDAVVEEFAGDLRETIRALLRDLAIVALDHALTVSHGYVRGRTAPTIRRGPQVEALGEDN